MDPEQQGEALRRIAERGEELLGIYHSHPKAPAVPSQSDIAQAVHYPDAIRLIVSLDGPTEVGAFRIADGRVEEVPLQVLERLGGDFCDLPRLARLIFIRRGPERLRPFRRVRAAGSRQPGRDRARASLYR